MVGSADSDLLANPSILYAVTSLFLFPHESWGCCLLLAEALSWQWKGADRGSSLLGSTSPSIRISHIRRLEERSCKVFYLHENGCSSLCRARGVPSSLPRLAERTQLCGWPEMPVCHSTILDFLLINIMLQCTHLSVYWVQVPKEDK